MITRRTSEHGFTIVEVMVAMLLLVIAGAGAMAMATSSTSTQSRAKLREVQAAIAEGALAKVKTDIVWPRNATCEAATVTPCKLSPPSAAVNVLPTTLSDSRTGMVFSVSARAKAMDSRVDGLGCGVGGLDSDGLCPDYYRIEVTVAPAPPTSTDYPNIKALTLTGQVGQSTRQDKGKLDIMACYVKYQIDERSPVAACPNTVTQPVEVVPPMGFSAATGGGTNFCTSTSQGYDCPSYTCAHPAYVGGCFGADFTSGALSKYVSMDIQPSSGWGWQLRGDPGDANTRTMPTKSGTLSAGGTVTVSNLTPGQYRVRIFPPSSMWLAWDTHSEPAHGYATVEAGLKSKSITMFKQDERAPGLVVDLETNDVTDPFNVVNYPYLWKQGTVCERLVPSPIGRVARTDTATGITLNYGDLHCADDGDKTLSFLNADPGLYASYVTYSGKSMKHMSKTPGFIWLPHNPAVDTIPTSFGGYGSKAMLTFSYCDDAGRNALNSGGFYSTGTREVLSTDPITGVVTYGALNSPWEPCGNGGGGGGGGPGGGGGGGT